MNGTSGLDSEFVHFALALIATVFSGIGAVVAGLFLYLAKRAIATLSDLEKRVICLEERDRLETIARDRLQAGHRPRTDGSGLDDA